MPQSKYEQPLSLVCIYRGTLYHPGSDHPDKRTLEPTERPFTVFCGLWSFQVFRSRAGLSQGSRALIPGLIRRAAPCRAPWRPRPRPQQPRIAAGGPRRRGRCHPPSGGRAPWAWRRTGTTSRTPQCGKAELWLSPFFEVLQFDILAKFWVDSDEIRGK